MLDTILYGIGLTEKEAKVYLANLKVGAAKVSEIAQEAKVNRVTTYDILGKLRGKGFVTFLMKDSLQLFVATDPENIDKDLGKKYAKFKSHINVFKSLSKFKSPLKISYFEGVDELKQIYFDTLDSKTEILNIINEDAILPIWPNYEFDYVLPRVEKKIYLRGIAIDSLNGQDLQSKDKKFYRQIMLVSQGKFDFSNDIMIYDDKVAILSWLSLGGVIINNQAIAETHRALFEMVWSSAEYAR
ncbi:MAG: transcriptional regulator TrmB [Candidatus Peregrinibacteria bacterium GW2011_GWF2_33_10]|nr:MAG: transcriptional regulator TrmB [Candidatus Peregrinibacteria bacterium GW2011_GWF2_33_10]OGJ44641.1 MAG: hypothetical protein A2263_00155 [Candidatus Peregrinibacteria bacterium RIFOXYA2_FULL_33_21]OGJ46413.1 MAG: hypothetical protein A2272_06590 [Candidatus Peregrinibacteria bacterium RIFOXYA12_FULL_33_12]OGJ50276.1 MAG: hypothetical protein A2307_01800 [Candidatus Peregrinibacteria bacterium RIFOXYB2_FULL_33_20]